MAKSSRFIPYAAFALLLYSMSAQASFIEQTLGAAVVNDATASYFNPAALTLLTQKQLITLGTLARSQTDFNGLVQQRAINSTQSGSAKTTSHFSLPSVYLGVPINNRFAAGFAVVINDFNRELDSYSILRYAQAPNHTRALDLVPALAIKINDALSIGAHINRSQAHFLQQPHSGVTSLNSVESQSINESKGRSTGWDAGLLIKLSKQTAIGFNYRSAMTYHLKGSSTLIGPQILSSNDYHFTYWTPARSVLSLSHFINRHFGLITTIQYLQWNIFNESTVYQFASRQGANAVIVPSASIRYHFHNSWLFTLGGIYKLSPKWTTRVAATYNQSPADGHFQIGNGDSVAIGSSMGYQLMNHLSIDCSYAHAFFKTNRISIATAQQSINGSNKGVHDSLSLKLTYSV